MTSTTPSAAPSAPSESGVDTQTFGEHVSKNPFLTQVAIALKVDPALTHRTDTSLRMWYKRYTAYHNAIATLNQLKAANEWSLADINRTELINLFGGRAYWHSHVTSAFRDIQNYPSMVEWLDREDGDTDPSDLDVWHLAKSHYTFKDLGCWKKEGTLDKDYQMRLKKKGKAKERINERKEKKRKERPDDSSDEGGTSRKGKKSSGKRGALKSSGSKSRK